MTGYARGVGFIVLALVLGGSFAAGAAALPSDKDAAVAVKVILYLLSACFFFSAAALLVYLFVRRAEEEGTDTRDEEEGIDTRDEEEGTDTRDTEEPGFSPDPALLRLAQVLINIHGPAEVDEKVWNMYSLIPRLKHHVAYLKAKD